MNHKHYIKKISSYAMIGGIGITTAFLLAGCDNKKEERQAQTGGNQQLAQAGQEQGQFLVIQETAPGKYKVTEQYPSNGPSRAILKDMNGTEKLLSEAELKALAEAEAKKVDNNTSNLTKNPQQAQMHGGGMSLGETILASAAGALIGGYIANKLFNNPNFQANQRQVAPSAISKPVGGHTPQASGASAGAKPASPQSGYFKDTAKPASSASPSGARPSSPASTGGYSPSRSSGG